MKLRTSSEILKEHFKEGEDSMAVLIRFRSILMHCLILLRGVSPQQSYEERRGEKYNEFNQKMLWI